MGGRGGMWNGEGARRQQEVRIKTKLYNSFTALLTAN